ncbi:biopolymer transporter ExbD [Pseudotabrizicola formosa]|uniref:biopolymer transporter ExbD n=1 Tax=Pseudotabrizicola formosa TaxID=2030009 RepID=UPI001FF01613|nr:biopolymer transporter ExbD [Pseudotabrizicola formosa]
MSRLRKPARRRALSMTSLIDVIFLLLLFFMLSSTFTRFGDLPLTTASGGAVAQAEAPAFLRLLPDSLTLDTDAADLAALPAALLARAPVLVIVAPGEGVTAQRLVDALNVLRDLPGVTLRVIGG